MIMRSCAEFHRQAYFVLDRPHLNRVGHKVRESICGGEENWDPKRLNKLPKVTVWSLWLKWITRDRNQIQTSSRKQQQQHSGLCGKAEERFRAWSSFPLDPECPIHAYWPCFVLCCFTLRTPLFYQEEDASLKSQVSMVFWAYNTDWPLEAFQLTLLGALDQLLSQVGLHAPITFWWSGADDAMIDTSTRITFSREWHLWVPSTKEVHYNLCPLYTF